jgi:predicted phosphodiesterase
MKYAILSDIHSNYEALKSVFEYLNKANIKNLVICGDIIGYGPQPLECVSAIMNWDGDKKIVLGNHDAVFIGKLDIRWFNDLAKKSLEISKNILGDDIRGWFNLLPEIISETSFTVVHGSLKSPLKEYLLSEMQYSDNVGKLLNNILFYGHTHIPMFFYTDENGKHIGDFIKPFAKIRIKENSKFFINPGSVGQPRDGNPMASFGIFDDETNIFELIRVNYDIPKVQKLMSELNIPNLLIERLALGY